MTSTEEQELRTRVATIVNNATFKASNRGMLHKTDSSSTYDDHVDQIMSLLSQHTQRARREGQILELNTLKHVGIVVDGRFDVEAKRVLNECINKRIAQLSTKDSTNKEDV